MMCMQNLVEKIEVIEFNNCDYWIQPIQKYPAEVCSLKPCFKGSVKNREQEFLSD